MKQDRQKAILELIRSKDISTQGQLLEALNEAGVKSTQATVSRDIKELNLVKEFSPAGVYRYVASASERHGHTDKLRTIFRESVVSIARAQNITVMKTLPGLAPAACSAIDHMDIEDLVGTLAGDDTAFLAMTDNQTALRFLDEAQEMLNNR